MDITIHALFAFCGMVLIIVIAYYSRWQMAEAERVAQDFRELVKSYDREIRELSLQSDHLRDLQQQAAEAKDNYDKMSSTLSALLLDALKDEPEPVLPKPRRIVMGDIPEEAVKPVNPKSTVELRQVWR